MCGWNPPRRHQHSPPPTEDRLVLFFPPYTWSLRLALKGLRPPKALGRAPLGVLVSFFFPAPSPSLMSPYLGEDNSPARRPSQGGRPSLWLFSSLLSVEAADRSSASRAPRVPPRSRSFLLFFCFPPPPLIRASPSPPKRLLFLRL